LAGGGTQARVRWIQPTATLRRDDLYHADARAEYTAIPMGANQRG
jgi:hypothetical protein